MLHVAGVIEKKSTFWTINTPTMDSIYNLFPTIQPPSHIKILKKCTFPNFTHDYNWTQLIPIRVPDFKLNEYINNLKTCKKEKNAILITNFHKINKVTFFHKLFNIIRAKKYLIYCCDD